MAMNHISRDYRIVRLGDLPIYKVQVWKDRWIRRSTWVDCCEQRMTSNGHRYYISAEFVVLEDAKVHIIRLKAEDVEQGFRDAKTWTKVWPA